MEFQMNGINIKTRYQTPQERIDHIFKKVCEYYKTTFKEMTEGKPQGKVWQRTTAYYLCRMEQMTLHNIGQYVGKDHSTVIHALQNANYILDYQNKINLIQDEKDFITAINTIKID